MVERLLRFAAWWNHPEVPDWLRATVLIGGTVLAILITKSVVYAGDFVITKAKHAAFPERERVQPEDFAPGGKFSSSPR
jgi:hypothetical protein